MRSRELQIGIDIDEVLASFTHTFVDFHNAEYGTRLTLDSFHTYHYSQVLGVSGSEATRRVEQFYNSLMFRELLPVRGSQSVIDDLSRNHRLVSITSRPVSVQDITLEWMGQHFGDKIPEVHFSFNTYYKSDEYKRSDYKSKPEICHELGIDLMIEDSIDYAKECAQKGIPVFLLDYPWNKGSVPENVMRVYSWQELATLIHYVQSLNSE